MMSERFGARWTSFTALLVSFLGFMLLWSTTLMKDYYHSKSYLQDIYFFISGRTMLSVVVVVAVVAPHVHFNSAPDVVTPLAWVEGVCLGFIPSTEASDRSTIPG
jgi:hypothetical protein